MDHITKLIDIYNRWLDKEENQNVEKISADEALWGETLTEQQTKYLLRFVYLWERARNLEYERRS
tara:strand:+ start:148 stop:342 length:195 start_codon:yes stop_codon:yes gene_type:complete